MYERLLALKSEEDARRSAYMSFVYARRFLVMEVAVIGCRNRADALWSMTVEEFMKKSVREHYVVVHVHDHETEDSTGSVTVPLPKVAATMMNYIKYTRGPPKAHVISHTPVVAFQTFTLVHSRVILILQCHCSG